MTKIHLFARDNRPKPSQAQKKSHKLLWFIVIVSILFVFFKVQILTVLFFIVGFIV